MSTVPTNPAHTNSRSAAYRKGGMRSSIRTKITFWAGLCLVLVSSILIGYSVITLRQTTIDSATKEAAAIADAQAGLVIARLQTPLLAARTIAYSLSTIKDSGIPISLSRDEVNGMLRKILIENPSFLGTYTLWEPNEFDGLDATFVRAVGHDDTGRFIPYWVRGDDGIIHTEALINYETPGTGDWYILPRSTKKEITIAPLFHRIQNQDVVIASFIVPIVQNNKFYGIAGVDAPIGFVQEMLDNINLYDGTANAVLFTDTGTLIAIRGQPELTNQPVNTIYADFDKIQPQLNSTFTRLSPDGKYLQIFSPIDVNKSGTRWAMGLIIPFDKITAPATTAVIRLVVIDTVLTFLALLFIWFLAGQIVRPIDILTDAARAVSQDNLTVIADVHSNDETELLANAFNSMTSQLRNLFATLEQRVADRTTDLELARIQSEKRAGDLQAIGEISKIITGEQKLAILLPLITRLVSEHFGFYHAGIFLLDETSQFAVLQAANSEGGKNMLIRGHRLEVGGGGIVGYVAKFGTARIALDVGLDAVFFNNPDLPNTRSEMALPLKVRDHIVGVLDVQSEKPGVFTQNDANTLSILADQIAIALENARLFTQTQQALNEAQTFYRQTIQESWLKFSREEPSVGYNQSMKGGKKITAPVETDEIREAMNRGNVMIFDRDGNTQEPSIVVPIKLRGQIIGVLNIKAPTKDRRWSSDEVNLAEAISERLSLALENARLILDSQRQAIKEQAISEVTGKIGSSINLKNVLQTAVEELGRSMPGSEVIIKLQGDAKNNGKEQENLR